MRTIATPIISARLCQHISIRPSHPPAHMFAYRAYVRAPSVQFARIHRADNKLQAKQTPIVIVLTYLPKFFVFLFAASKHWPTAFRHQFSAPSAPQR